MSKCKWCGVAVMWIERIPYEGQVDHRTRCVAMEKSARRKIVDRIHETAVNQFLQAQEKTTGNKGRRSK